MATPAKHWTVEPDGEIDLKITESGPASLPSLTLIDAFKETVSKFGDNYAMKVKRNDEWISWTYRQYYDDTTKAAKSMIKLGLEPLHGVGITGFNSPEWFISFMGCIMAGGMSAGVYATNNTEACQYIGENCQAQLFICENQRQVAKILEIKDRLPHLKVIVKYIPESEEAIDPQAKEAGVLTWEEFMEAGKDVSDDDLSARVQNIKVHQCASLVYTSGTTGPPKGVMLSHDNLLWSSRIICKESGTNETDVIVSFLPLSHIAGQLADVVLPAVAGYCVAFAQPDALKGTIRQTLLEVNPTLLVSVPRVLEKFKEAVSSQLDDVKGIKKVILTRSQSIGKKTQANRQRGRNEAFGYGLANKLVYKGLREKLGLTRCKNVFSGAAPLPMSVTDFFGGFDIPIYQLYGMSECTGVSTYNIKGHYKPGAAGRAMPGVEMKVFNPDEKGEGELCFRGRHVFMGYLRDEERTKQAMDDEGWLHSGDVGRVDEDGYYFITGRLKEIIITKGGENVAPVPIEETMKEIIPILSNVVVIGDEQRFLTMLVTLRCELDDDRNPTDELDAAAKHILNGIGCSVTTVSAARTDPAVTQFIQEGMIRANEKALNSASRVQKFTILPVDFSLDRGELTPTMKLKRRVVYEMYKDDIDKMYSE